MLSLMSRLRQGIISLSGRSQPHCERGVSPNLMLWYMTMADGDDDDNDEGPKMMML